MKVLWIFRAPVKGVFSIENLFGSLEQEMRKKVQLEIYHYDRKKSLMNNVRAIRSYDTDIYHITGGTNFLALLLPAKKTVITVHDIDHYLLTLRGIKKYLFGLLWWKIPLRRSRITCISQHTKEKLIDNFKIPDHRITVIPNCVDARYQSITDVAPIKNRILQVGTKKNKNLERVIEALEGIDCVLVIVGRLNNAQQMLLEKHKIKHENLLDLDLEQLIIEYNKASLVTFISTSEGFGLPLLEAQVTGTPVITSDIEPMRAISNGCATLTDPYSISDIRQSIVKLLSEDKEHLIISGLNNAKSYSANSIASDYYNYYVDKF
ncbi:glycosyltransferase family 4 protein [Marinoscillum pacificum]|uniref:glycosyltransferase family 4 protein n=1 Tax=Marinoscillum pacificum TaxID=392723 RepID=UPI00215861F1|nr:glycosyltransferase family 1 protein [Marinoscillum pacificum]